MQAFWVECVFSLASFVAALKMPLNQHQISDFTRVVNCHPCHGIAFLLLVVSRRCKLFGTIYIFVLWSTLSLALLQLLLLSNLKSLLVFSYVGLLGMAFLK